MTQLLAALAAFVALHSVPALPALRARLIARLGRGPYLAFYSLASLLSLAWVFHAALAMDTVLLWGTAPWQGHLTLVAAPLGLFLVIAGLISPNPASITLRRGARPGAIVAVSRHPVLWGFLAWALGHLAPNGDLGSLVLFGGLALFSAAGLAVLDRRARRRLGSDWPGFAAATSVLPFAAALGGRTRLSLDRPLLLAAALTALATWALLAGGHAALFGADPRIFL